MNINLLTTIEGTPVEKVYPKEWDMERIHNICGNTWEEALERQDFWHPEFEVVPVEDAEDFHIKLGLDIAMQIRQARKEGREIGMILPIGPVGQYRWAAYFLNEWDVKMDHVYSFNMDDWADENGNISGQFGPEMTEIFYDLLDHPIPKEHLNFAYAENLKTYPEKLGAIQKNGGEVMLVQGIGRPQHVAFWDPHYRNFFDSDQEYLDAGYLISAKLSPLTIEQNACLVHQGNFTKLTTRGNTISIGLMMKSDYTTGGINADHIFPKFNWQGIGIWTALRYGPNPYMPDSYLPTKPGKFFFVKKLAEVKGPFKLRP